MLGTDVHGPAENSPCTGNDPCAGNSPSIVSFGPVFDAGSRVLILGTAPSPASLAYGFFYGHPQNAFWRILRDLTGDEPGKSPTERRAFLLRHGVALWDTLSRCERVGALDGNIRAEVPSDVAGLLARCSGVRAVFLNGGAALRYFRRYHAAKVNVPFYALPSTSPANARGGYGRKLEAWKALTPYLD